MDRRGWNPAYLRASDRPHLRPPAGDQNAGLRPRPPPVAGGHRRARGLRPLDPPHRIAQGYSVPPFPVLKAINGVPVRNLKHLVELIRDSRDRYLVFEWFDRDVESLVFNRDELLKSTDEVLADNDIRNAMSDDLLPTWQGR